jgi:DNA-binding FadR family transcriptional regulator
METKRRRSAPTEDPPAVPIYLHDDPLRHGTNLAASVAAAIERHIVELGWPVGAVIGSETELLERYDVSRPVMRQATGILESHQVARMRRGPGGGLVVIAPSEASLETQVSLFLEYRSTDLAQVTEARESIELTCVELATARLDEPGIARLRELVRTEPHRVQTDGIVAVRKLHETIGELSGNHVLDLFMKTLSTLSMRQYSAAPDPEEGRTAEVFEAHAQIVEAIVAGDSALARHRMLRHIHQTSDGRDSRRDGPRRSSSACGRDSGGK